MVGGLTAKVVQFGSLLREHGFDTGSDAVLDSLRALEFIGVERKDDVKTALATVMVRKVEQRELFDQLFESFWQGLEHGQGPGTRGSHGLEHGERGKEAASDQRRQHGDSKQQAVQGNNHHTTMSTADDQHPENDTRMAIYSPDDLLWRRDFAQIPDHYLPQLRRLAWAVARRLATRISRRTEWSKRKGRIDYRRSMRLALRHGGHIIQLQYRRRSVRRSRLSVICDVSGSMVPYANVLLLFAFALQQMVGHRVETFTFGTRLVRVTPALRRNDAVEAVSRAVRMGNNWAGGTRIGYSLSTFRRDYAHFLAGGDTTVIILSDGLDTGEIDLLKREMEWLRRHAAKIIWLNPLAGDERYQPLAAGMAAALPYIDVLAPAHNLESLATLERYI